MPQISEQWAYLLNPTIHHWFQSGFARRASLLKAFYSVQPSQNATEQVTSAGAIGLSAWENYENSGAISEAGYDQGYLKTYTHREYILDVKVQRKLYDDSKYPQIMNISQRVGDSAALLRETHAASTFNNAFTGGDYAGADGVALCSDSHPYNPHKRGNTQSNLFTLALTADNVDTVRQAMQAFTDDQGQLVAVTPRLLLVPPALENTAITITESLLDPTSAENAINPQKGRFSVITWHYLTDSNAWFMIDPNLMKMSLDWFERVPYSIYLKGGEDHTVFATWRAYMRYSYGFSDWRWIAGSNPS